MAPIAVHDLSKYYGDIRGIDDLSFTVKEGEVFGFLGPNGAGKTTTIRTLLGLMSPTSGSATVLGADIQNESELIEARRNIGYLPDHLGFDEEMTGAQILAYHAAVKGDARRDELVKLFTPPLDRPVRGYSSGNKRMLGIIQAFMHDPDLVILDEPTSGLDPLKQEQFNEFIREERAQGTTIFFSSHILSEVRQICDRIGIVRDGTLVELEEVETLLKRSGKRVRVQTTPDGRDALAALEGVVDVHQFDERMQFIYTGEYNELFRVLSNHDVLEADISEPPLEDIFLHYYGEEPDDPEGELDV
ncbi:ABC transporter ATP-binding protein [Natronosalvus vescus]|uniref:ABC transporter ATP-binding protein n=1 Tax=Natronosalvus vescus TaxID=2953881 RepID=UPI0020914175|nr:ABC transporter ATP-binding protein [Natronosalvus vescus]